MTLCARLRNQGEIRVGPGIEVTFFVGDPTAGGEPVCVAASSVALEPGDDEVLCCSWSDASIDPVEIYAVVDSADSERECREENNSLFVGREGCAPIG